MAKPYCPVPVPTGGACMREPVQRVIVPGRLVTNRCKAHRVSKAVAKREGWTLIDIPEATSMGRNPR